MGADVEIFDVTRYGGRDDVTKNYEGTDTIMRCSIEVCIYIISVFNYKLTERNKFNCTAATQGVHHVIHLI